MDEMKRWKFQVYAERIHRLALDMAVGASQLAYFGRGVAVVAEETRNIANKMYKYLDNAVNEADIDLRDLLEQLQMLTLNGAIELLRLDENEPYSPQRKGLPVIAEELRQLTYAFAEMLGYPSAEWLIQPELKQFSTVTCAELTLLQATVGGRQFVENTRFIQEIYAVDTRDSQLYNAETQCIQVRGTVIPVINLYTTPSSGLSNGRHCAVIVNTDWDAPDQLFAVLVDKLAPNALFVTRQGVSAPRRPGDFPADSIRECWDTAEGRQAVFLDWKKFAE